MCNRNILILGDILAIAVVTLIGFARHGETSLSFLPRFLATFVPLIVSWFLLVPWLGLFKSEIISIPKRLWRPALAMLFAAPLAALVRAIILKSVVIPIFVIVLGTTSALGMTIWRGIYFLFIHNKPK